MQHAVAETAGILKHLERDVRTPSGGLRVRNLNKKIDLIYDIVFFYRKKILCVLSD